MKKKQIPIIKKSVTITQDTGIIDIRNFKSFPTFKERFLSYFPKNYQNENMIDSCWNWEGTISSTHCGLISYGGFTYTAARMSYLTFNGPVRSDQVVRHTCDNRICVNPKHLILGSYSDNSRDMIERNRGGSQKLNEECVKVIKWMLKYKPKRGLSAKLARLHKVDERVIAHIKAGNSWSWVKV